MGVHYWCTSVGLRSERAKQDIHGEKQWKGERAEKITSSYWTRWSACNCVCVRAEMRDRDMKAWEGIARGGDSCQRQSFTVLTFPTCLQHSTWYTSVHMHAQTDQSQLEQITFSFEQWNNNWLLEVHYWNKQIKIFFK